jgi:hypothetical protein
MNCQYRKAAHHCPSITTSQLIQSILNPLADSCNTFLQVLTITIEEMASSPGRLIQAGSESGGRPRCNSTAQSDLCCEAGEEPAGWNGRKQVNANGEGGSDTNSKGIDVEHPLQTSHGETVSPSQLTESPHDLPKMDLLLKPWLAKTRESMGSSTPSTPPPSFPSSSPRHSIEGNQECNIMMGSEKHNCGDHPDGSSCCTHYIQRLQQLELQLESLRGAVTLQTASQEASRVDANVQHASMLAAVKAQTSAICLILKAVSPTTDSPAFHESAQSLVGLARAATAIPVINPIREAATPVAHAPPTMRNFDFTDRVVFINQCSAGAIGSRPLSNSRSTTCVKATAVKKRSDACGKISPDLESVPNIPVPTAYESNCDLSLVGQGYQADLGASPPNNLDQGSSSEFERQGTIEAKIHCAKKGNLSHVRQDNQASSGVSQSSSLDLQRDSESIQLGRTDLEVQSDESGGRQCPDSELKLEVGGGPFQQEMPRLMHGNFQAQESSDWCNISGLGPGGGGAAAAGGIFIASQVNWVAAVAADNLDIGSGSKVGPQQQWGPSVGVAKDATPRKTLETFQDLN